MKDRRLLFGGLASLALGLLGLLAAAGGVSTSSLYDLLRPSARAAVAPPWEGQASGRVREFSLTVGRSQWELAPGKTVQAYTYNGQVPGPELRFTEGDTVRVTVTNELSEPTTVHWHGVEVPVGMDGVPKLSQKPIAPGASFIYEFVAVPAGTRWYHAHFNELAQQGGGLVGALVIEPRAPANPQPSAAGAAAAPDREYALVTGGWVTGTVPPGQAPPSSTGSGMMGGMGGMRGSGSGRPLFDTFAVNGKAYPATTPLLVRQGERVRLRLINAGATQTQAFALAGHRLTLTHSDGNPLARPVEVEAVLLGVGERADVEFSADNPGRWQLRGLFPGQFQAGLGVDLVYEGHEADPPRGFSPGSAFQPLAYAEMAGPAHPAQPDRVYQLTLSGGMMDPDVWTINGKSYPDTEPIRVRPGERVRLKLFNMSMEDHPMHLHGHTFQVVAIGGRPVDGPLKDTLTVRHMEQYEIEFVANNPGNWLFHCHNLHHMHGGLMTEIHYR